MDLFVFINIIWTSKMSDRHYSGSYFRRYDPNYTNTTYNPAGYDNQPVKIEKERNSYDIKESNISQQTIIHRARLYSPDKSQEFARYNFNNNDNWGKTKAKRSQITAKIHEIVDLCEDDRDAQIEQFKEVVEAEKKILDMLRLSQVRQHQVAGIDMNNFAQAHQDRGTTFGPIRSQNNEIQKIQSKQVTKREVINDKSTITRQNIYKKSAIDDLKTDRNFLQEQSNLPAEIKQITQINKPLNDQTEKMIQEIQRKAMDQIQNLRNDKIQLMRKLNEEIRAHNQEKKLRIRLEMELARIRGDIPNRASFQEYQQPQFPMHAKNDKKYYSQPHQPQKQKTPAQTYYPPPPIAPGQDYSHHYPQNNQKRQSNQPVAQFGQQRQQNEQVYEKQIQRLQAENNSLMRTIRSNSSRQNANVGRTSNQNNLGLKYQVVQLNQLIEQYESEMGRIRGSENMQGVNQLENLLEQGERIELDALKLLNRNGQQMGRRPPISKQIQEQTINFKRSLFASEHNQGSRQINANARNSFENIPAGTSARVNSYKNGPISSNRIQEFERILSDMNNAAR